MRASHACTLLPAALASVPFGFVLVRVRVRVTLLSMRPRYLDVYPVPNRGDLKLISLAEIVAGHLGGSYDFQITGGSYDFQITI